MLPYTPFLYDTENVKETLERTNRVTKSSMQKAVFHLKEVDKITASISQEVASKDAYKNYLHRQLVSLNIKLKVVEDERDSLKKNL